MDKGKDSSINTAVRCIDHVAEFTDSCFVFCSLGKDSLVVLDLVYPRFKRVICVFMYFVKGLDHIERWIAWVKGKYPKVEFVQVPHWNLSYIMRNGLLCTPNSNVKLVKLADIIKALRLRYHVHYCFLGMKKADGMNRHVMLNGYGEWFENGGLVYPLANMNKAQVLAYMKHHRLPTPIQYGKTAANGCGFNVDFLLWMRENAPADLQRVYNVFPLTEKILFDHDRVNRAKGSGSPK